MRKLKRSLAVLLVLVMAFAMVPFAGANTVTTVASFNDGDDVTPGNLMALDVLAAVDVLRGEDGNIYPQRTITRAEAATIVARVLLGPGSADQLPPGRTGFRDVDNVSGLAFASGAIAYLHERGIVIGIGDDLFDPQAPVTGAELATMFLRAVGFGVNGEYTGPRWQTNAVVDGMQWRILSGNADFTAPATREQVFRYAFNAMNTSGSIVGLRFVNWSADRQAYVPVLLQGIDTGDAQNLQTIWRRVFEPSPIVGRRLSANDIFNRPATRFTLRGLEIGLYPEDAVVTFTAHQSTDSVRAAINQYAVRPATVNGVTAGVTAFVNGTTALTGGGADISGNLAANISALTGNGVLVEIFVNSDTNEIYRVTAIRTDISEVTRINAARTSFTLAVITPDGDGGIRSAGYGSATSLVVDDLSPLFDTVRELNLGAKILVSPSFRDVANGEVGALAIPETVTGRLSSSSAMVNFENNTGSLTVDGTVYRRARIVTLGAESARMTAPDQTVTLVLDEYGFIVDTETTGISTRQLVFVTAVGQGLSGNMIRPLVRGRYPDGTEVDVVLTGAAASDAPPVLGSIIRITGTGNNVNWADAFEGDVQDTINATSSSIQAMVASLESRTTQIAANQSTLMVGGRNLRFADDAKYFHWDNVAQRFAVRDRSERITGIDSANTTIASPAVVAVVEYRVIGQAPVISALWIGMPASPTITAERLVFIQGGGSMHTVIIDGTAYSTLRAFGVDGQPLVWNAPEDWPNTAWVAIDGDTAGSTETGWYLYTIDSNNRFELDDLTPGSEANPSLRPGNQFDNLGVFTAVIATTNGLTASVIPFTFIDEQQQGAGITWGSATLDASTFIRDIGTTNRPAGMGAIEDRGALRQWIEIEAAAGRNAVISVVYDARNGNLASAVFVHASS